ncbi:MAG: UDP-N-acetylmuramoyl-L-alanine--D-glutamate ligase [Ktedonobacterales bacterium]|jgi:UDP-N-acetylmuramoylalanine--D-glutamate ligase|nr:MAG: UDP-N-acetylmuramoyl-L-alanine--D-glutamate ligase [Ktedonobacterales bacterium]
MSDEHTDWHDVATTPDDPNALRGRRVLVMGLGLLGGGVGAARYAVEQGAAEVVVTDLRGEDVLAPSIAQLAGLPIRYVLGRHDVDDFTRADVIVRNPNVRRDSPYLAAAHAAGRRVEMEIAWFFRACRGKIAGVTGTRGKSTTTILLHHILSAAGMRPLLGGNLGNIETLALLPEITPDRWVVLELGNWMLEGLHTIRRSPRLAIFTNLLPDHLNAYDSMADYGEAKTSIFRYQGAEDIALFNADNEYTRSYADEAPGGAVWLYSPEQRVAFRRDMPNETQPFAYADAIRLRGAHNLGNVQAATLAAELIGVAPETIRDAVASFGGVPHRLEVVRELDGVTYVNDSASTAPVAGIAALRSFAEPLVLIAGGNSKNLDFGDFAREAAARAERVIVLKGNASDDFAAAVRAEARALGRADLVSGPYDDFARALAEARVAAQPGAVVLLSPGFTSFGMFLHEFDRGDQFRRLVLAL